MVVQTRPEFPVQDFSRLFEFLLTQFSSVEDWSNVRALKAVKSFSMGFFFHPASNMMLLKRATLFILCARFDKHIKNDLD